jgi:hypothetical protein
VPQAADGGLQLGLGWQLAASTTISTGFGAAQLDLSAARWDADQIDLGLETWGSIEVLVQEGVTAQVVGGSGRVQLQSLCSPVPDEPVLRISTSVLTEVIQVRHPKEHIGGPIAPWRRRRTPGSGR